MHGVSMRGGGQILWLADYRAKLRCRWLAVRLMAEGSVRHGQRWVLFGPGRACGLRSRCRRVLSSSLTILSSPWPDEALLGGQFSPLLSLTEMLHHRWNVPPTSLASAGSAAARASTLRRRACARVWEQASSSLRRVLQAWSDIGRVVARARFPRTVDDAPWIGRNAARIRVDSGRSRESFDAGSFVYVQFCF